MTVALGIDLGEEFTKAWDEEVKTREQKSGVAQKDWRAAGRRFCAGCLSRQS